MVWVKLSWKWIGVFGTIVLKSGAYHKGRFILSAKVISSAKLLHQINYSRREFVEVEHISTWAKFRCGVFVTSNSLRFRIYSKYEPALSLTPKKSKFADLWGVWFIRNFVFQPHSSDASKVRRLINPTLDQRDVKLSAIDRETRRSADPFKFVPKLCQRHWPCKEN